MKIGIVGAGAMGLFFGSQLLEKGYDPIFFDVDEEKVNKLNEKGLFVNHPYDVEEKHYKLRATSNLQDLANLDYLMLFVKSYNTLDAMDMLKPILHDDLMIITLQNGLTNVDYIKQFVKPEQIIAGITTQGAAMSGYNRVYASGGLETLIGYIDGGNQSKLEEVVQWFTTTKCPINITDNVIGAIWTKVIVNSIINPMTAISGIKNGELLNHPDMMYFMKELCDEGKALADKKGIKLLVPDIFWHVQEVCQATAENTSSMLVDLREGRFTEVPAINYALCQEGEKNDMYMVYNATLIGLLAKLEQDIKEEKMKKQTKVQEKMGSHEEMTRQMILKAIKTSPEIAADIALEEEIMREATKKSSC